MEILPVSRDANDGPGLKVDLAYVETLVGESDAAAKRRAYLLTIPPDISVPLLRAAPCGICCAATRGSSGCSPRPGDAVNWHLTTPGRALRSE